MVTISLLDDMHIHSTFSDGVATLEEILETAAARGLRRIVCVDHVRRKTPWVPVFVQAVRELSPPEGIAVRCGLEAKILDTDGNLDVSPDDAHLADFVLAADHQFPQKDGCRTPTVVRGWLEAGERTADGLLRDLIDANVATMHKFPGVVLAHLFSILPKIGLSEAEVDRQYLEELAQAAADTGSIVEISERWRCPSPRVLRTFLAAGVPIHCSTDSHAPESIGRYEFVSRTLEELEIFAPDRTAA